MKQDKIQELAEELWFDLADESDGWQTTMNYESFIKAIHKALTIPDVVGQSEQLKAFLLWLEKEGYNCVSVKNNYLNT